MMSCVGISQLDRKSFCDGADLFSVTATYSLIMGTASSDLKSLPPADIYLGSRARISAKHLLGDTLRTYCNQ